MSKKRLALIGLFITIATTVGGAHVWIHARLDEKISVIEFDRFIRIQLKYQEEVLKRLRSIEEALR